MEYRGQVDSNAAHAQNDPLKPMHEMKFGTLQRQSVLYARRVVSSRGAGGVNWAYAKEIREEMCYKV